ncbi:hypothetical protein ACIRU8_45510 [Streptomyces sp. NPDC101175]|uniref:hypothetical protein n=1 Tax=Streptomyces sp. NPDC101175 TaxID=3366123 RepID=UPI00383893D2
MAARPSVTVVLVVGVVFVVGLVVKYGIPALFPESSGGLPGLVDARTRARSTERHWDNVDRLTELAHPGAPAPTTNGAQSNRPRRRRRWWRRESVSSPPSLQPPPEPHTRGSVPRRTARHVTHDQHGRGGGARGRLR